MTKLQIEFTDGTVQQIEADKYIMLGNGMRVNNIYTPPEDSVAPLPVETFWLFFPFDNIKSIENLGEEK